MGKHKKVPFRQYKGCITKVRHDTEASAWQAAGNTARFAGKPMGIYKCGYCDGWHVTKWKRN